MWPEILTPREGKVDFKLFYSPHENAGTTPVPFIYTRPAGAKMLFALGVAAGGGGGGGFSRTAGSAGGGGGGGCNGHITRILVPWDMIPNTLLCFVATGSAGGAASTNGASITGTTAISIRSPVGATGGISNLLSCNAGSPGTAGTGAAAGGGGAVGSAHNNTNMDWIATWGQFLSNTGTNATAGGAHTGAVGVNVSFAGTIPLSGGAGGGGSTAADFAGGNITGAGPVPTILGGQNAGDPGADGFISWKQFMMTGGAGGASNNAGTGGKGGDGAPGCGGGGGGAGVTGGAGGRGGNGLIMLWSW